MIFKWLKRNKECKSCGTKLTPDGCRFCYAMYQVRSLYDALKNLEENYYRMGGFQIVGKIDKGRLGAQNYVNKDPFLNIREC